MSVDTFGFVVSANVVAASRGPVGFARHSMDRQVVDSRGTSSSSREDSKSRFPTRSLLAPECLSSPSPNGNFLIINRNCHRKEYTQCI